MSRTATLIRRTTVVSLLIAALAGISTVADARAALGPADYYVSWPAGDCWSNQMQVHPPQMVSPTARDGRIAWRVQLWQWTNYGWVKDIARPWHWADVINGVVHAPHADADGFTINRAGHYAVTGEIFSYGMGDYRRDINLNFLIHTPFYNYTTGWCRFGV